MMTKEDYELIEVLVNLKQCGMYEKEQLQNIIRKYMDPGFSMCFTCDPQVRHGFQRLKSWWEINKDINFGLIFNNEETTKKKKK